MPKVKVPRSNPSLDMTPMVDLAFLLVTFFMLTATFRTEQAVVVDTPSSISEKLLPDNVLMVTVDTAGRVFYNIDDQKVRVKVLENMASKYAVKFSPKEIKEFELMKDVGMPMADLKKYLAADQSVRMQMDKSTKGIPYDSITNELADWILFGRVVDASVAEENGEDAGRLKVAIKGDSEANYATIRKIMKVFQDKKVNSFSLVTNLEGK
jgi:biopolymer transport protein ExbD